MPNEYSVEQPKGKTLLSWAFSEYEQHDRSPSWYIFTVLIAIALLVWALWTQNYLFAIILVLASFLLIRQHRNKPTKLTMTLTEDGVDIHGRHFYPFKDFETFWMVYEPPEVKMLYMNFKTGFRPRLSIPLENTNPLTVRQILSQYIVEDFEREGEPTAEAIARLLKL